MTVIIVGRQRKKPPWPVNPNRAKGRRNGSVKLQAKDVRWIRKVFKSCSRQFGAAALARKLRVSTSLVQQIADGQAWKHLL